MELLKQVRGLVEKECYLIENVDATVIAQRPKLAPYIEEMREKIAETLGVGRKQVNVKATTEEHLGFTGEGLGIRAQAVCMLTTVDNYIYEDVLRPGAQTGCQGCQGCRKGE